MIRSAALLTIIALRIFYQPGNAQSQIAPFTSQYPSATILRSTAQLISFTGNLKNNKVILEWKIADNAAADQFEVEKSTDGKNYTLAGLVFGTDKQETGSYLFFEKAGKKRSLYRIKLIN